MNEDEVNAVLKLFLDRGIKAAEEAEHNLHLALENVAKYKKDLVTMRKNLLKS